MSHWMMYLITRLDTIRGMATPFAVFSGLGLLICSVLLLTSPADLDEREKTIISSWKKIAFVIFVSSILAQILTPTTKDVAAIYLVPKIVNNEDAQKLPGNAAKFLNAKLEEWVKDSLEEDKSQ